MQRRDCLKGAAALGLTGLAHSAMARMMTDPAAFPPLPPYPANPQVPLTETVFGQQVSDPWRWLEADVRHDAKVAEWVKAQSAYADAYLSRLPERPGFAAALHKLMDYERLGLPQVRGGLRFFRYNPGLLNQAQLRVVAAGAAPDDLGRVLLDPAHWAGDGATALDDWEPAEDGRHVAYGVQDGGTDWRTVRFVRVADGQVLPDELRWVSSSGLTWVGPETLVYSRFPAPPADKVYQAINLNHSVWLHRLGTPQSEDVQVHATPDHPTYMHYVGASSDQRWLVIATAEGTDPINAVGIARIENGRVGPVRMLIPTISAEWRLIDGRGDVLWFISGVDAPRRKVVRVDLSGAEPRFDTVVPQADEPLDAAAVAGDRLVLHYLHDAHSRLRLAGLDGADHGEVTLPAIGTVGAIVARAVDREAWLGFVSFTTPTTVLKLDPATGQAPVWHAPKLAFDPAAFRVEQVFYPSKDGTRIPMFVVRQKSATGPVPTLLYGYGGFNISMPPHFDPAAMAWVQAGGAYALANLRGGGEYGDAWHDAGRRANKQNVFDDCIAAGEWLIANGVCAPRGLAVQGHSNGGLLVGAVVNQRPDLFAAANAGVGVMDMLRFDRFTSGRYWVDDYGHPDVEADWKVLRAYSPYHNIRDGVRYPAVLVTTADTDDRVIPGHSFKYAARLQTADAGPEPHLIRIETRAGHGAGKPIDKVIAEDADVLAFLAHWTGLGAG